MADPHVLEEPHQGAREDRRRVSLNEDLVGPKGAHDVPQAVQRAVQDNMALNPGSDVARFNGSELGRRLRRSLDSDGVNDYQLPPPERYLAAKDD